MPYLVCDKCGEYYELQPSESPDDFIDKCECGGTLRYVQNLNDDENLQKVCPKCGNVVGDKDEVCSVCGFKLKKLPVTEKQLLFGFLWYLPQIGILMIGVMVCMWALWVIIAQLIFHPPSTQDFYSDLWIFLMTFLLFIGLFVAVILLIRKFQNKYLSGYGKKNLNWSAIGIAFVIALIIGSFGGRYLPNNVSLIGPLIGGFIAGCIVGKSYINGLIQGGLPAGIAGFAGFLLIILLFGNEITIVSNTSLGMILTVALVSSITYFIAFFIIGSIGGMVGATLRKRISHLKNTAKEVS